MRRLCTVSLSAVLLRVLIAPYSHPLILAARHDDYGEMEDVDGK